jgi:hypothetical protein
VSMRKRTIDTPMTYCFQVLMKTLKGNGATSTNLFGFGLLKYISTA